MKYENTGVNYQVLDEFKKICQYAANNTKLKNFQWIRPQDSTRGESAFVYETKNEFLVHVEEGLGSKNIVADEYYDLTNQSFFENIGIDLVSSIVNDLVTTGGSPISLAMYVSGGTVKWFENEKKAADLVKGFKRGCDISGALWSGGETSVLIDAVSEKHLVLAGSSMGMVFPKAKRIRADIKHGDIIIFLGSNGVHTNGLTLCRKLASTLKDGYRTKIEDTTYGEALLAPSFIYNQFMKDLSIVPHYASHITGHGWRKIMRANLDFAYRIHTLPEKNSLWEFLQKTAELDNQEMYGTFNMGTGFALIIDPKDVNSILDQAKKGNYGYPVWVAGEVQKADSRNVSIEPLDINFNSESLKIRA